MLNTTKHNRLKWKLPSRYHFCEPDVKQDQQQQHENLECGRVWQTLSALKQLSVVGLGEHFQLSNSCLQVRNRQRAQKTEREREREKSTKGRKRNRKIQHLASDMLFISYQQAQSQLKLLNFIASLEKPQTKSLWITTTHCTSSHSALISLNWFYTKVQQSNHFLIPTINQDLKTNTKTWLKKNLTERDK